MYIYIYIYIYDTVRESLSQPLPSTATTCSQSPPITRSQSPEFWSPAPAVPHQHPYILHTLSDTHRPVYGSLPWTVPDCYTLTCVYLPPRLTCKSPATIPGHLALHRILQLTLPLTRAFGLPSPVDKNSYQFVHEPPGFSLSRYSPSLPSPYSLSSLQ